MFRSMKQMAGALLLLVLACSVGAASPRKPLTDFQPRKDFFQVANDRGGGYCFGIVESAIVHWDKKLPDGKRLANIGKHIIAQETAEGAGKQFLQDINMFAQNHSNLNAVTRPQAGKYLADVMFKKLERRRKPQVLGLDQADGTRHALVVYDAEKRDGKIVFRVGDPNYPGRNDLSLVYDRTKNRWTTGNNYPKDSKLIKQVAPHIIHWNDRARRIADIPSPVSLKFMRLVAEVEDVVRKKEPVYPFKAQEIGRRLELTVYQERKNTDLSTGLALDQWPTTQTEVDHLNAAMAAYERAVAQHNRKGQEFTNADEVFASDGKVHLNYASRFNEAARRYNNLPAAQRTKVEHDRLRAIREVIEGKKAGFQQRYKALSTQQAALNARKTSLGAERAELMATANRLGRSGHLSVANGPFTLAPMPFVTLEALAEPFVRREHPFIGSWLTMTGPSKGRVWAVAPGGRVTDSGFSSPGTWRETGASTAEARFFLKTARGDCTCTYQVTVRDNGTAGVSWRWVCPPGIFIDPNGGSFELSRQ